MLSWTGTDPPVVLRDVLAPRVDPLELLDELYVGDLGPAGQDQVLPRPDLLAAGGQDPQVRLSRPSVLGCQAAWNSHHLNWQSHSSSARPSYYWHQSPARTSIWSRAKWEGRGRDVYWVSWIWLMEKTESCGALFVCRSEKGNCESGFHLPITEDCLRSWSDITTRGRRGRRGRG